MVVKERIVGDKVNLFLLQRPGDPQFRTVGSFKS